ncbi:hypothetical protein I4U23_003138 [Adineta vaga]|nr:hypothetical protein I4U23_003138 [Adineta vaga]
MSGYVTVNRLSRVQISCEDRKQQAHLKKIGEMQRRSGLDTSTPTEYPHLTQHYNHQAQERKKQLAKENDFKLRKLLGIMRSKTIHAPATHHSTSPTRRQQTLRTSQSNAEYRERIANAKGIYDVREWNKDFQEHKEHLKLSKNSKLYTPCDIAMQQQRTHDHTTGHSKRPTPASSNQNTQRTIQNND